MQLVKDWAFLNYLLESPQGRVRLLATNQQVETSDLGQVHKQVYQPYFAYEAGDTDQHDVFSHQSLANGERGTVPSAVVVDDGANAVWAGSFGGHTRGQLRIRINSQLPRKLIG